MFLLLHLWGEKVESTATKKTLLTCVRPCRRSSRYAAPCTGEWTVPPGSLFSTRDSHTSAVFRCHSSPIPRLLLFGWRQASVSVGSGCSQAGPAQHGKWNEKARNSVRIENVHKITPFRTTVSKSKSNQHPLWSVTTPHPTLVVSSGQEKDNYFSSLKWNSSFLRVVVAAVSV